MPRKKLESCVVYGVSAKGRSGQRVLLNSLPTKKEAEESKKLEEKRGAREVRIRKVRLCG